MTEYLVCEDRRPERKQIVTALSTATMALTDRPGRVRTVENVDHLVAAWTTSDPDVVMLGAGSDCQRTLAALRALLAYAPVATVLCIGRGGDHEFAGNALLAGAVGYLQLAEPYPEAPVPRGPSVRVPAEPAGDAATSSEPSAPEHHRQGTVAGSQPAPSSASEVALTQREAQVLAGISRGQTHGQIAAALSLTPSTVKSHTVRLFRKLKVANRADAVAAGFRCGLLP